ncbi:TPA_asm: maturation protein [ssRNA phage Gephyllon.1_19]|uniref:Maturation protein n=2 Tax=Leviviricetes TaxID=2842243 RepID=A0A8S5KYH0_9VIRU|nr:maturation protein [ssRNA phage Gephyllon.1_19]QDH90279.1 MAG: hypothetical protein H1BulkLitter5800_000001 [Leviviridae sp.]DAD50465.1 TPA_asm: maturation protein [ssRNA phage Gephyllon.1_19]
MGKYVTQKRSLANRYTSSLVNKTGVIVRKNGIDSATNALNNFFLPSEQTYMYRSGRRWDSTEEVADLLQANEHFLTPYDNGHEYWSEKQSIKISHPSMRFIGRGTSWFDGPLIPYGFTSIMSMPTQKAIDVASFGPRAIAATVPTKSVASLAQFLGELHEGLPKLIGSSVLASRAQKFRSYGSEYLNVQFGWLPFVNDLRNMLKAVVRSDQILKQYARDSGKMVRRKFAFPPIIETSDFDITKNQGYWANASDLGPEFFKDDSLYKSKTLTRTSTSIQKYRFSGAYSYFLAGEDTLLHQIERHAQEANKLLGIKLTPDVLWELAPWSWLSDWVFNLGLNIGNASKLGQDGLVVRYGYLMRDSLMRNMYSAHWDSFYSLPPITLHVILENHRKESVRSSPYGFGLNPNSFTERQWSILAALGMTKAPRTLW